MGEGKGPDGGDGGLGKKEAGPLPLPPVVLGMELHCAGCAKKVQKCIKHMPGVESVVADAVTNRVVVAGTADAAALKARIEAKTKKPVEVLSGGGGGAKKAAALAESKAEKDGGGEKKKSDKDGGGGEKKGDKGSPPEPKEEKEKKQPLEEKKPEEETVLLKIRLHCDGCADRIRRRIYKIKGVRDVVLESNAKDEVKVTGTMDVAAMLAYLKEKLNRTVEAVAPGKKDGDDGKKDKGGNGDGDKKKDKAAAAGGDDEYVKKDKGKGIEVVGPSTAAAAASMAPPPAEASTYHVSPYGHVAYPQPQGPQPSYYGNYGGNADGAWHANAGAYYQQNPSADAGTYYQHPSADAGAGAYYHHPGADAGYNPQPYPYRFDMAPAPQMFSDENPNACSVM